MGSKEYEYWAKIEAMGASDDYAQYRAQLEGQTGIDEYARQYMKEYGLTENELQVKLFEYGEKEALRDAQSVFNKENGIDQRVGGAIQAIGGGVEVILGVGSCAETVGLGCVVAAVGTDNAFAGIKTVWTGNPTKTSGAALLESMGVPKEQSEIVYALMTGQVGMLGTAKANQVVTTAIKLENGDVVNVALNLEKNTLVAQNASKVGSSSSTTSNAGKGTTAKGSIIDGASDAGSTAKIKIEYTPEGTYINQTSHASGGSNLCGPTSCTMAIIDKKGNVVNLDSVVKQFDNIRPTGVNVYEMKDVLIKNGIPSESTISLTANQLRELSIKNQSTIVGIRAGEGGHFIIVDSYKKVDGVGYYMVRDPYNGAMGVRADLLENKLNHNGVILK